MLAMALLIVPTALAPLAGSMWTAVLIVQRGPWRRTRRGLPTLYAGERHVPARRAVGLGSGDRAPFAGGIWRAGRSSAPPAGFLQANGNNYTPIFIVCGLAYVLGLDHHSRSRSAARAREHRMNRQEVLTMRQSVPRRAFLTATAASVAGARFGLLH